MTLGQLIAFRIWLAITNPLLRLANLWQNFQETALSMERLADIVDHPEKVEIVGEQKPPFPCSGQVDYAGRFSFIENLRYNSAMLSSRFQLDHLLVWWEVVAPARAHC